ncbi:MAG TPA: AbrB/MazE/SpoVT family DNA-binding domain-containing protein [Longimicrobium sp.]|nr:AbrB/MazE/SpoVT family DNA-binding domain-containing protein [Longimicrobium sp.]
MLDLLFVREDEDGLYIRLPADVAARLDARPGERVELTEVEGGFVLSPVP